MLEVIFGYMLLLDTRLNPSLSLTGRTEAFLDHFDLV